MFARALKTLLLSVLALLLVLVGVFTYARLTAPSPAQREAMALLEARAVPPGDEGAAWLRFAQRPDVPDAEVLATDARERAAWRARGEPRPEAERSPMLPASLLEACGAGCLDALREAPEKAAMLAAWEPVAARLRRGLAMSSVAASPEDAEMPSLAAVRVLAWLNARDFVAGRHAEAIESTCTDIAQLRRHSRQPGGLIELFVFGGLAERSGELLAAMLAEAPALPLPAACGVLAAPPTQADEGAFCVALAGEYVLGRTVLRRSIDGSIGQAEAEARATGDDAPAVAARHAGFLFVDEEAQLGMTAEAYAVQCGPRAAEAIAADDAARLPWAEPKVRAVDWVGHYISTVLVRIGAPAYGRYGVRHLDLLARQRLLAARLLLHGSDPARPLAERIAALPAWVHSPTRRIEVGEDGASLRVAQFDGEAIVMPMSAAEAAAAPDVAP